MELFTKEEINTILFKSEIWLKGFTPPPGCSDVVNKFSRLSNRKKLLTLILLTDPENNRLPNILSRFYDRAGSYAWNALNWVIPDAQRVSRLLENVHINDDARHAIQIAVAARRCVDEISKILNADTCQKASLAIAQHGSSKQRLELVRHMTAADAESLVCQSDPDLVLRCIEGAQSISPSITSINKSKKINELIRHEVLNASQQEGTSGPFLLEGRGHESRVTLDISLARILRGLDIPRIHIDGFGPNFFYPARVFVRAAEALHNQLGWYPIGFSTDSREPGSVYRVSQH